MIATAYRILGRSGIRVSPMGLGCWAIGGPFWYDGKADGWGFVDDRESVASIRHALDLGITFFDTADVYGTGHSEIILGKAIRDVRKNVVIATKFGNTFDEKRRIALGEDVTPSYIRSACEASLKRLNTDYIDLYQLHLPDLSVLRAGEAAGTLQDLVKEGLIRAFGWSTDDPGCASLFMEFPGFTAVQHTLNVFDDAPGLIALCERENLASIGRSPLAMGFLSGKFTAESRIPPDDVRGSGHAWVRYFANGRPVPEFLEKLSRVRDILTMDGRTPAQGALCWIWGRSRNTIPVPGFKNHVQVSDNAGALRFGPFSPEVCTEIDCLLGRNT